MVDLESPDRSSWNAAEKSLRQEMSQCSLEILQRCVEGRDDGFLDALITDVDQVQDLQRHKEALKERNRSIAKDNLAMEPILNDGRSRLHILHEEAKRLSSEYEKLKSQYEELNSCRSPDMAWVLLKTASAELDRDTEQEIEKYFEVVRSGDEISKFLDGFLERRAQVHMMKVQADKLEKYVRDNRSRSKSGFSLI